MVPIFKKYYSLYTTVQNNLCTAQIIEKKNSTYYASYLLT